MKDWLELTLKVLPAAASVVFIVLSSQFVSRSEFIATSDKFSGRIEAVEKLLIRMESSQEKDRMHDQQLSDHESRIRTLEHR